VSVNVIAIPAFYNWWTTRGDRARPASSTGLIARGGTLFQEIFILFLIDPCIGGTSYRNCIILFIEEALPYGQASEWEPDMTRNGALSVNRGNNPSPDCQGGGHRNTFYEGFTTGTEDTEKRKIRVWKNWWRGHLLLTFDL